MKISKEAEHGKRMTLDELEQFVVDARTNSIPGNAKVFYRPSFGSGLRELTVNSSILVAPTNADPDRG